MEELIRKYKIHNLDLIKTDLTSDVIDNIQKLYEMFEKRENVYESTQMIFIKVYQNEYDVILYFKKKFNISLKDIVKSFYKEIYNVGVDPDNTKYFVMDRLATIK